MRECFERTIKCIVKFLYALIFYSNYEELMWVITTGMTATAALNLFRYMYKDRPFGYLKKPIRLYVDTFCLPGNAIDGLFQDIQHFFADRLTKSLVSYITFQ